MADVSSIRVPNIDTPYQVKDNGAVHKSGLNVTGNDFVLDAHNNGSSITIKTADGDLTGVKNGWASSDGYNLPKVVPDIPSVKNMIDNLSQAGTPVMTDLSSYLNTEIATVAEYFRAYRWGYLLILDFSLTWVKAGSNQNLTSALPFTFMNRMVSGLSGRGAYTDNLTPATVYNNAIGDNYLKAHVPADNVGKRSFDTVACFVSSWTAGH